MVGLFDMHGWLSLGASSCSTLYGVVYKVPQTDVQRVIDILDFREKGGYSRARVSATILEDNTSVDALVYSATADNPLFAGQYAATEEGMEEAAQIIAHTHGPSGANSEYLFRLAEFLRSIHAQDPHVFDLELRVQQIQQRLHHRL
eukprot:c19108_g1_i1.p1 GENE.c19108_g1_i1~~c19108_g1_i1.p1  ORF type:complete len:146 (+),score=20.99 c19108_g1_i1:21-458(+)